MRLAVAVLSSVVLLACLEPLVDGPRLEAAGAVVLDRSDGSAVQLVGAEREFVLGVLRECPWRRYAVTLPVPQRSYRIDRPGAEPLNVFQAGSSLFVVDSTGQKRCGLDTIRYVEFSRLGEP